MFEIGDIFPASFAVAALYAVSGSLLIYSGSQTLGSIVLAASSLPAYRAMKLSNFGSDYGKGI